MVEIKSFSQDCSASEFLLLRFVAAIIIFAALLSIALSAEREAMLQISEQQIQGELQRVEKSALLLHRSGGGRGFTAGSLQVLKLQLPESMSYAAFGSSPVAGGDLPLSRGDEEANVYHYRLQNGRIQSFSSNVKFCAAEFENGTPLPLIDRPAILRSGSYEVYLELVRLGNESYVMIYRNQRGKHAER